MCQLESNSTADDGFTQIRRTGDKIDYEMRLAQMASEDSIRHANGLHSLLEPVLSWWGNPILQSIRKVRIGRHRAYIQGRHTDCRYLVVYIKVHKRDEERREEDARFQGIILRAFRGEATRVLDPPPVEEEDEEIDEEVEE